MSLTLSVHALEGHSSHFVCLSVADLEDGGLLALQRDMNLNWMIYPFSLPLFLIRPGLRPDINHMSMYICTVFGWFSLDSVFPCVPSF